jgi:hypothetical protein
VRVSEGESPPSNLFSGTINSPLKALVKASAYLDGGYYNFHVTHPSGSIMILASANYNPGKLDGLKTDICHLGIGAMGSKDEDSRRKYWKEAVEAMRSCVTMPVHWDNFGEPLANGLGSLPGFIDNISESKAFLERSGSGGRLRLFWSGRMRLRRFACSICEVVQSSNPSHVPEKSYLKEKIETTPFANSSPTQ